MECRISDLVLSSEFIELNLNSGNENEEKKEKSLKSHI